MKPRIKSVSALVVITVLIVSSGTAAPAGPQQEPPPRFPTPDIVIPAACLVGGQVTHEMCEVIEAAKLGWDLSGKLEKPDAMREVAKVLAKTGGKKLIVLAFPPAWAIDIKLAIVEAAMEYEARMFEYVLNRIESELMNAAQARLLAKYALLDSQAVQSLRERVFAEHRAMLDAVKNYLTANPNAPGFRFNCHLACQQLISAAQGINVFDSETAQWEEGSPTDTAQAPNPAGAKPPGQNPGQNKGGGSSTTGGGDLGMILVLGAVGAAVAAAAPVLLNQSGGGCGPAPTIPASCVGIGRNTAQCNAIIEQVKQWCSCNKGTFNVNTGQCVR